MDQKGNDLTLNGIDSSVQGKVMGAVAELKTEEEKRHEIGQIKINLGVICVIWVFAFTAYSGLQVKSIHTSHIPFKLHRHFTFIRLL